MKIQILFPVFLLLCFSNLISQDEPSDYLSPEFHKDRRNNVRNMMPKNSVSIFFANPVRNRANDVDYHYHQDPNFYYLTGFREPHAILLIFSEDQLVGDSSFNEVIFVQERNELMEMWNGKRLGAEGVKSKLGFENAYTTDQFTDIVPDFSTFDSVLFFDFKNDVRDDKNNPNDLFSLIEKFKTISNYPVDFNPEKEKFYDVISLAPNESAANVAQVLKSNLRYRPSLKDDKLLDEFQSATTQEKLLEIKQKITLKAAQSNLDAIGLTEIMRQLREIKTQEELKLMSKAAKISAVGQVEVMKAMNPELSEMEIQGIHEFVYKKYNVEYEGYPSIVGGGHNGCILHYIENTKMRVGNDLVLMDLGAEYHGYTADVTRTIPANGTFSYEQKAIYDLVYEAQEAGIKASVVGAEFRAPHNAAVEVIKKGLVDLGIIVDPKDYRKFFPHGTSHYVGLDVHDPGTTGPFKPNTIITVEPGIYIPDNSDCDPKWWGIAVRIEDTVLISDKGPVNLSNYAPRKSEEIEKLMRKKSPLSNFVLPEIQ
ncbi:MAG: aminopeptidase P N-terminal domain-containing protein [Flavobacteriaceae bacterium]|nr:aminopeptidase P N-terminal domain-containing protein [Flavobacteriaceae bacterium]